VRGNQTPAPSPPKVLNIPDPFHPLDHTYHESPTDSALLSTVAAAINTDDNDDQFSIHLQSSQSMIRSVGRKGSFNHDEDNSKDPTYKQPELEDDDLFYSDDELLDAEFERGLDEVGVRLNGLTPKKTTTDVIGQHLLPDYTGMTEREKENAKEAYEIKRKAFTDVCQ
jgi:hypothetical protein